MNKIYLAFLLTLSLNASNLSEIINLAQSSNLAQISSLNPQAAQLKYESVRNAYLPNLTLQGGYAYQLKDPSVLTPKSGLKILASIELLLYDGGRREASLAALKHMQSSEILKNEDFKNSLALNACKLYFNAIALDEIIKAKEAQMDYLQNALVRLDKFFTAGLASIDELEAIRAKFEAAKVERLEFIQKRNEIIGNINLLTNRNLTPKTGSKIEELELNQNSNKASLKALEEEIEASKQDVKSESSNTLPKIFIKNTHSFYKNDFDNDFSNLDPRFKFVTPYLDTIFKKRHSTNEVMLGFSWKIFDFGATSKQKQIKEINSRQAALNLDQKRLENSINLKNLRSELAILKEKIKARQAALNAANSSYDAVWKKYDAGLAGYVEFLQALTAKFEAKSGLELSKDEFEIKKAEFLYENGEEILKRVIDE
ncbi:TolC family protein [Campylobacter sp.]|uniref:TolC family protein n=1 Tax=Campylobacter sp. TaxID=205 RepID=UPI00270019CA|nr:TolC family protein [Campylobacter sp.]